MLDGFVLQCVSQFVKCYLIEWGEKLSGVKIQFVVVVLLDDVVECYGFMGLWVCDCGECFVNCLNCVVLYWCE